MVSSYTPDGLRSLSLLGFGKSQKAVSLSLSAEKLGWCVLSHKWLFVKKVPAGSENKQVCGEADQTKELGVLCYHVWINGVNTRDPDRETAPGAGFTTSFLQRKIFRG